MWLMKMCPYMFSQKISQVFYKLKNHIVLVWIRNEDVSHRLETMQGLKIIEHHIPNPIPSQA